MHLRGYFQANAPFGQSLVVAVFVVEVPMPSWVSMETLLDPGRGIVQKGLLRGVDFRGRRLFR